MHKDAVGEGHNVLIVDDLLATGGTSRAVVDLVEGVGGKVAALLFVVELTFLNGRAKFEGHNVKSLISYDS
jgi:adenine phosphoribosyltransferase